MEAPPAYSGRHPLRTASSSFARSSADIDSPSSFSSSSTAVIQSLSSILNNPHASRSDASWSIFWPSAIAGAPDFAAPIASSVSFPEVSRADFQSYLSSISDSFSRFEDVRNHTSREEGDAVAESRGQGEALVACLREVPALFFKEDFALEEGATFRAACPFSPSAVENTELQERLTHYLDVVEMHLVREISLRSDSFFEAQGQLERLNEEIAEACARIRELKGTIRILTGDLVGSAKQVQELNATRGNFVGLHQKLTVILYVSQALSALKLLVVAADCAGSLDVIDDLQHLLDTDELTGLHCFRHLRDQLAVSSDTINSILSAEFVRSAMHDVKAVDSLILSKMKAGSTSTINGLEVEVKLDDDECLALRDRLLPLIFGLLRTAKLPSVLRIYRDTIITEMKAAIKSTVAQLLPVLLARASEADLLSGERTADSEGVGLSLASKLRSLSSESFVQLLMAIFKVVQAHLKRAAEVKKVIEWMMGNLESYYDADSATGAIINGPSVVDVTLENEHQVFSNFQHSLPRNAQRFTMFQTKPNDNSSPITSKNFRADVLRENTEAVFAACDAAHGRWAKLLGVRALLHPKLRLQEFLSIYDITQDFITATEKIGGRLGYSIRGAVQSQSRSFVDFQHESRMTKIKAVLDQETWVAVDVPEEFQALVASFCFDESSVVTYESFGSSHHVQFDRPDGFISQENLSSNEANVHLSDNSKGINPMLAESNQASSRELAPYPKADGNSNESGKSASHTLVYGGVGYHMVNCGLILLKMLSEYVDISKCLPSLASEVVHRVAEILKLFNTRTCQLVLGAGAMQVSGLKSITSKHLALASQIISFIYVIIPDIQKVLFLKIPEGRKSLLLSEIERVAQDYKVHRDEIHSKLVQIMRERLLTNLRKLPQVVETWNAPEDSDQQPSQFAKAVTKEVTYLHRILSQTLLEDDVQAIFRQVVQIFHSHISETFSKLVVTTPQAKNRLFRDIQAILECIRKLPSDDLTIDGVPNYGLLDVYLAEKFGEDAADHVK
ncbi:hypothetical protein AXF42_Ash018949 [Apostasia shenzhenica]|uniref:Vacuolar protein sorting-associated protein 54 C-terminal domain-containing protein n=1 Tax=Apostasia shenzhenica TaxID=1088818 RepID=A0A2I0B4N9_9ASPA|nr:hypothetical protein AXF42_Ash018949 [Apostasia shenzhenica]